MINPVQSPELVQQPQQAYRQAIDQCVDETKHSVRKEIEEVGAEISRLTNTVADVTKETVDAVGEITDLALDSQKDVIDSMQSVSADFADRIYGGRY